jgi:hypothetical protein
MGIEDMPQLDYTIREGTEKQHVLVTTRHDEDMGREKNGQNSTLPFHLDFIPFSFYAPENL